MFHTLDKEELNLSIGPMALSVAEVGDFTRDYGTYIGDIKVVKDTVLWLRFLFEALKWTKSSMCKLCCYINSDYE